LTFSISDIPFSRNRVHRKACEIDRGPTVWLFAALVLKDLRGNVLKYLKNKIVLLLKTFQKYASTKSLAVVELLKFKIMELVWNS